MLIEYLLAARPQWGWVLENEGFRDNIVAILKLLTHRFVVEKAEVQMTDAPGRTQALVRIRSMCF